MTFIKMLAAQIKRILSSIHLIGASIFMPIMALVFILIFNPLPSKEKEEKVNPKIHTNKAIVWGANNDSLMKRMEESNYGPAFGKSLDRAKEKLDSGDISIIYQIPEAYVEKKAKGIDENIEIYVRRDNNRSQLFETEFANAVKLELEKEILKEKGVYDDKTLITNFDTYFDIKEDKNNTSISMTGIAMMLIVYIILNNSVVGNDLVLSKENNMLKRMLISPNSSFAITTSFLLGHFFVIATINIVIASILKILYGFSQGELNIFILTIILASLLSTSIGLYVFRIFKNKVFCSMASMMISLVFFLMSFITNILDYPFLEKIELLSPISWMVKIIDKQIIMPSLPIILLYTLLFISLGSYKLEKYIKE